MKLSDFWVFAWKFTNFLMSHLKTKTLNQSTVSSEITLLNFFGWNFIWVGRKEPNKVQNFRLFYCSREISLNFYFMLLLVKVHRFQVKTYSGVMSNNTKEWRKMLRKSDFLFKKWHEFGNLIRSPKILKKLNFDGFILSKVYSVWLKKYQTRYLTWHWRVMQNLAKNWLVIWKIKWDWVFATVMQ